MKPWKKYTYIVLMLIFVAACIHCSAHDDMTSKIIIAAIGIALAPDALRALQNNDL